MRKQLLRIALVLCMALALVPQAACAAETWHSAGEFRVRGGTEGTDYSYANGVLKIISDKELTIYNYDTTWNRILVDSTDGANIVLAGVDIDASSWSDYYAAFTISKNSGSVTITLADGYENTLKGGNNRAGLQKENEALLVIKGGTQGTGKLSATGGMCGAGIGGGIHGTGSDITIEGGEVTATGGAGGSYDCGGAGIGGGAGGTGSHITIKGGEVTATGGAGGSFCGGAGIGGGCYGAGSNITINGGNVTAKGGSEAAGIGGGFDGAGKNISITDGFVVATGTKGGTGIGGGGSQVGYKGIGSDISISGGTVIAKGSHYGAGIGGGMNSAAHDIEISGGVVSAYGGDNGPGIGGASGYWHVGSSNITISGGIVTAQGGKKAAGIGGGRFTLPRNIVISGGSVKALKGDGASNDIGGDRDMAAVTPTLGDGTPVYLLQVSTDGTNDITIDGKKYSPKHTTYYSATSYMTETNVYAYVTGENHTVTVNGNKNEYHLYDNKHHIISPESKYSSDETGHWYACKYSGCSVKIDSKTHTDEKPKNHKCDDCDYTVSTCSGGEATCTEKAVCDVCKKPYGETDKNNHSDLKHVPAKDATAEEPGNIEYWYCKDCNKYFTDEDGKKSIDKDKTVIDKLAPKIIKGDGQTVTEGVADELEFTSNAGITDFVRVEVDGKTVDATNYTVKSGSTIVTLNGEYVATLSVGEHTIGVVSEGGTATAKFNVEPVSVANLPKTGDNSQLALWLGLLVVCCGLLTGLGVYGKKRAVK